MMTTLKIDNASSIIVNMFMESHGSKKYNDDLLEPITEIYYHENDGYSQEEKIIIWHKTSDLLRENNELTRSS